MRRLANFVICVLTCRRQNKSVYVIKQYINGNIQNNIMVDI